MMEDLPFNSFINQTLFEGGNGSGFSDYADYRDFLHHVNSFNFSDLLPDDERDRLLALIRENVDLSYWCNERLASLMQTNLTLNTSIRCNTSTNDVGSVADTFWEAGKVRIPLYSTIFLLGITGNVLVILTLFQNSRMRTVTNLFLLNLAFSDLLLGVFCMPFTLVGALLRDFIFGQVFCKLIPFLQAVSVSVSGWTLVAISVERFYAICHPLTSRKWQTRRHARSIILAVWIASLTIMSPITVLSQLKPVGNDGSRKCREIWPDPTLEGVFTVFLDVVLLITPLIIMATMYGQIINHLWKVDQGGSAEEMGASTRSNVSNHRNSAISLSTSFHRKKIASAKEPSLRRCNPEHCLKTKRRVLKMLIVVMLEFFICWTPLYVVNTISFFAPDAVYQGLGYTAISMFQLLSHSSCCCNPITYCFMSSSFRRAFLRAFGCAKKNDNAARSIGTV